jgi:hypothetical protein
MPVRELTSGSFYAVTPPATRPPSGVGQTLLFPAIRLHPSNPSVPRLDRPPKDERLSVIAVHLRLCAGLVWDPVSQ